MEGTSTAVILGCGVSSIVILSARLVLRKTYYASLPVDDYMVAVAIVTSAGFTAVTYVSVLWGTANLSTALQGGIVFTPEEIRERIVGSKCTLASRVMYFTTCVLSLSVSLSFFAVSW